MGESKKSQYELVAEKVPNTGRSPNHLYLQIVEQFSKGLKNEAYPDNSVKVVVHGKSANTIRVGLNNAIRTLGLPLKAVMRKSETYLQKE